MALIVELVYADGRGSYHRLDRLPISIGRDFSNDIIVSDAYVDPVHARIEAGNEDTISLIDVGSINGTFVEGKRTEGAIVVRIGSELRIGTTKLRFHDANQPSVATRPYERARDGSGDRLALSHRTSWSVTAGMVVLLSFWSWIRFPGFDDSDPDAISAAVNVFAVLSLVAPWVGIWSLVTKRRIQSSRFAQHAAVASAGVIAMTAAMTCAQWLSFMFPGVTPFRSIWPGMGMLLLIAAIAAHLAVMGIRLAPAKVAIFLGASAVLMLFGLLRREPVERKFSHVPRFEAQINPMPAAWIPTHTVDAFLKEFDVVRSRADRDGNTAAR